MEAWGVFILLCACTISTNFTQKLGLSSAMPSTNIAYKMAVDMKATKQARGYSHGYQDGTSQYSSEVRNSEPATRNSICGDAEIQNYSRK
jgi:hypothetical protein